MAIDRDQVAFADLQTATSLGSADIGDVNSSNKDKMEEEGPEEVGPCNDLGKQSKKVKVVRKHTKSTVKSSERTSVDEERTPLTKEVIKGSFEDLRRSLGSLLHDEVSKIKQATKNALSNHRKIMLDCIEEKHDDMVKPILRCIPELLDSVLKLGNKFIESSKATEEAKQQLFKRMDNLESILQSFEERQERESSKYPQQKHISADKSLVIANEATKTIEKITKSVSKDLLKETEKVKDIKKPSSTLHYHEKKTIKPCNRKPHLLKQPLRSSARILKKEKEKETHKALPPATQTQIIPHRSMLSDTQATIMKQSIRMVLEKD